MHVLSGMGGVGKTSLARAYAQRHLDDYGIVWWVHSEDPAAVDAEYRALLEILLPPGEATKVTDARTVAFGLLANQERPWLLVLDNVPDPTVALPPPGNGHVLITSRATGWPELTPVMPLGDDAAVELLTSRSGDDDQGSAKALTAELGGLPLALTQAAGFVRTNGIKLAAYLRLYRERDAELLTEGRPADYPHTVATTWQLAIDRLTEPARAMLNVFAFCAPDAIPVHLLFVKVDELGRHRAIGELRAYSLITPAGSDTVSVHRLVQAVTRDDAWANTARKLIMAAMPSPPATATTLATWNALHTHVHALLDHLPTEHHTSLITRHNLAFWTAQAGDAVRARDLFAEVVSIERRVLGEEHPDTLTARHNLAFWTGQAGDAVGARDLFTDLLPIYERVLGAEYPETLVVRHNQAFWIGQAGDAAGARDLFAELVSIEHGVLGDESRDTLGARSNLARWTAQAGDAAGARDLFAELVSAQQRVLGPEHPDALIARHNLAHSIGQAGDAVRARDLFTDLLPIYERVFGAEHPETLATRHSLAVWTGKAGDAVAAWDLFGELIPICERVLGTEHPDTINARRGLASLAFWAGLAGEAEEAGPGGGGED